jgi:hypothetical protein
MSEEPIERRIARARIGLKLRGLSKTVELAVQSLERITGLRPQNSEEVIALAADVLGLSDATILELHPDELLARLRTLDPGFAPPTPAPSDQSASGCRTLCIYAGNIAEERFREIEAIIDSNASVDEKLKAIDRCIPIPPTASARQIAKALGVDHTAVLKTQWWQERRRGLRQERIESRRRRLKENGRG